MFLKSSDLSLLKTSSDVLGNESNVRFDRSFPSEHVRKTVAARLGPGGVDMAAFGPGRHLDTGWTFLRDG